MVRTDQAAVHAEDLPRRRRAADIPETDIISSSEVVHLGNPGVDRSRDQISGDMRSTECSLLAVGQKYQIPLKKPIGKGKNRPKPVVFQGGSF